MRRVSFGYSVLLPLVLLFLVFSFVLKAAAQQGGRPARAAGRAAAAGAVEGEEIDEGEEEPAEVPGGKPAANAVDPQEELLRQESEYIGELMRWGFADYAEKATAKLAQLPGAAHRLLGLEIKSMIMRRDFDKARDKIAAIDRTKFENWTALWEAAEGYFAAGMMVEVQKICDAFFKQYPKPPEGKGNAVFYKDSAYKYAQMLRHTAKEEKSLEAYGYATNASPSKPEMWQMCIEMANICIKLAMADQSSATNKANIYLERAKQCAERVQWDGIGAGLWFGKSIVAYAQIELLLGRPEAAIKIVDQNREMLEDLHEELLKSKDPELIKLTPMAECRYMIGKVKYDRGMAAWEKDKRKDGLKELSDALQHLYNVFVKYPQSTFAAPAGKLAQDIFRFFEANNIPYKVPENFDMRPVVKAQFNDAAMLMNNGEFEAAADKYREVLSLFPEYPEESQKAVVNVAKCYIELQQMDFARAVLGYIADRFSEKKETMESAGDGILRLASERTEANDSATATELYRLLATRFPKHPRRGGILLRLGDSHREQEDYDGALAYYTKVGKDDGEEAQRGALNRISLVWRSKKEWQKEIDTLGEYMKMLKPGAELCSAQYRLATSYVELNKPVLAVKEFRLLLEWLRKPEYAPTEDDKKKNKDLLGAALFNTATAWSKVKEPADKIPECQDQAIKAYLGYVDEAPDSEFAPKALLRAGMLQQTRGDSKGAASSFDRLQTRYRASPEAGSMYFQRAIAFLELGYIVEAKKSVQSMIQGADAYTAVQFLDIARKLTERGEVDTAAAAFKQALKSVKDPKKERGVIEGALYSLAEAYDKVGNYAGVIENIRELTKRYPMTGYLIESCFMASRACAQIAVKEKDPARRKEMFNTSVDFLNRIVTHVRGMEDKDRAAGLKAKVTLESAAMNELKSKAEETFGNAAGAREAREAANGAYFGLFELSSFASPAVQPARQDAFVKLIPYELASGRYDDVIELCSKYLTEFETGSYRDQAQKWIEEAQKKTGGSGPSAPAAATNVPAAASAKAAATNAPAPALAVPAATNAPAPAAAGK